MELIAEAVEAAWIFYENHIIDQPQNHIVHKHTYPWQGITELKI
jgi:hypothetical protein